VKTCRICGLAKPLDEFHRHRQTSDGRNSYCKPCVKTKNKRRCEANREQIAMQQRQWYLANRERVLEEKRAQYWADPEPIREANRRYHREHWPEYFARKRGYYRDKAERYRQENPGRLREYNHKRRAQIVASRGEATAATIRVLLTEPCVYCDSMENIEIDHIVPLARGGTHTPENLAPACRSCNRSKGAKLLSEWKVAA
jgi:5-methylcytosine-specific restriction endonuclease McrA